MLQDGLQSLHGGHCMAVGGQIVVLKSADFFQPLRPPVFVPAIFDVGQLADEPFDDFDPISALAALAPRLEKGAVIVIVHGRLEGERRPPLDRAFDPPFAGMAVPDTIVEPELHFLLDVARKIIGCDPRGVNIESRLPARVVFVNQPHWQLSQVGPSFDAIIPRAPSR